MNARKDHDHSYKLLFSHPEMVADLLRGFVHEEWVAGLDFTSLEKVGGSYVTDDLREREDDVIWRLRWGQEWLYVYLLLEFQSSIDPFMAVRIMVYVGMLYQDLIRSQRLTPSQRLPPVLPLVLYNGNKRWNAPQEISDLIVESPVGLEHYRPRLRYFLLDEGRLEETELAPLRNLAAALFRMENSRNPEDVGKVLDSLLDWLKAPGQDSLRRAFTVWLKRVLLPGRVSGVEFSDLNELQEVRSMLAERVVEWTRDWKQQGIEEGRQEGRLEGRLEGRQEGLQEGKRQGKKEGEAALLTRQLELRFGSLDDSIRRQLQEADAETLLRWGERILTAKTAGEVVRD